MVEFATIKIQRVTHLTQPTSFVLSRQKRVDLSFHPWARVKALGFLLYSLCLYKIHYGRVLSFIIQKMVYNCHTPNKRMLQSSNFHSKKSWTQDNSFSSGRKFHSKRSELPLFFEWFFTILEVISLFFEWFSTLFIVNHSSLEKEWTCSLVYI